MTLVSDRPGTLELRELSLTISTTDGMVVVVGCSHPGVDKIVDVATRIHSPTPSMLGWALCLRSMPHRTR